MRITIFTIGTEGDVRPLVALGRGLKREGHEVTIATGQSCLDLVSTHGLHYRHLTGDFRNWMVQDKSLQKKGLTTFSMLEKFRSQLKTFATQWPQEGLAAAEEADLLIGGGMVFLLAASLAEMLGRPLVETQVVPTLPSEAPPLLPMPHWMYRLPGSVNRMLGHLSRRAVWHVLGPTYQEIVRPGLGLAPYPGQGPLVKIQARHLRLLGYSPLLVPPSPAWPDNIVVTGAWTLDEADHYVPSPELQRFLQKNEAPIYVGFGSMYNTDANRLTDIILEAASITKQRFVLATGWGGLQPGDDALPENIHVIRHAPHDWLFPQMALAIHHGGAGTTLAATRAGIPSIVAPVFGDQPFWASRLNRLGVAPRAIPRSKLTPQRLAAAVDATRRSKASEKAKDLGERLRLEDGVAKAITCLRQEGLIPR